MSTRSFSARCVAMSSIRTFYCRSIGGECINEQASRNHVYGAVISDLLIVCIFFHAFADETFTCSVCSKVFATKLNMDSHIKKIHTDNKKFVCDVCSNSFSSAPNLKQHIKTVHEVEVRVACLRVSRMRRFNKIHLNCRRSTSARRVKSHSKRKIV